MAVRKIFEGDDVQYPTVDNFGDLPNDFQYQLENKSRYGKETGRKLTLDEAFEDADKLGPEGARIFRGLRRDRGLILGCLSRFHL